MGETTWKCTLQELQAATAGEILSQPMLDFAFVGTDTRKSMNGQLFIALKGDQFDAHEFVQKAVEQGASVLLVHEWREEWKPLLQKASVVKVKDTLLALQALGQYWRRKHKFKVLAISGSNGKTSTKEFTRALIQEHFSTYASKGSFNNHWGVPLSILQAGPEHKVLILEMGMNHLGELWRLCQIAEPNVVAITMVGRSHIGELGSQANIAKAKEEVYQAAPKAIHVFNIDNEWTMRMQSRSQSPQITFSAFRAQADVHMRAQRLNWDGLDLVGHIKGIKGQTWVHVLGRQNTTNLMCAASLALAAGLTPEQIWQGLSTIQDSSWGRNQVVALTNGARVLFDAYNANPDSMQALFKNLYEIDFEGRKFLVIGDMLELGESEVSAHEEVGEKAGSVNFDGVWYIGKCSDAFVRGFKKSGSTAEVLTSPKFDPEISKKFLQKFKQGDLIAVKASRGMHLEDVVMSWPLREPLGSKP
jgi:UDP-N-acetylmuramoyl-tripeptide--D-alanyl-D-alanine ligase